jgi:uncharacterized SAM-dependent methyltransferase
VVQRVVNCCWWEVGPTLSLSADPSGYFLLGLLNRRKAKKELYAAFEDNSYYKTFDRKITEKLNTLFGVTQNKMTGHKEAHRHRSSRQRGVCVWW